jgi:hypothetical protein
MLSLTQKVMEGVMLTKRTMLMVGGTVSCALGIGFVMQSTTPVPHAYRDLQNPAVVQQASQQIEIQIDEDGSTVELEALELTSSPKDLDLAELPQDPDALPTPPSEPQIPSLGCTVTAKGTAGQMASVDLDVEAPCLVNQALTVHHSGLMFSGTTDHEGRFNVSVPALSDMAVFIVDFPTGDGAVAVVPVPDLENFDRVAIQWSGENGLELHAREFGASYGEQGHVWSGISGGSPDGGQVVRLGDAGGLLPRVAEVYSFPTSKARTDGTVALSVEAEVTGANCGRDISAQTFELRAGGELRTRDLDMSVPACSAIGDFLVLNNLLEDLKIAAK